MCFGRAVAIPAGIQVKGLLQASLLSVHSLPSTGTQRHTQSTLFQHTEEWRYLYLPFFRSVGRKYLVSTNDHTLRLQNYSVALNAVSISVLRREGTRLDELHLSPEASEA